MNNRQLKQLEFQNGDNNLCIGAVSDLPFDAKILEYDLKVHKIYNGVAVEKVFNSGLTAIVYKLRKNGKYYNFKKKRVTCLVKNADGQTSFLNEIQRRIDFNRLRANNKMIDKGIVKTIYADFRKGIIVSEWIDGKQIEKYNEDIIRSLFDLSWNMEINGIMEWDLCSANLLVDSDNQVKLFDFGYCYTYDPLTEYNSEGKSNPEFNFVERFETRAFMPYLLELESIDIKQVYSLFRMEKEESVRIFEKRKIWLKKNNADDDIIENCENQLKKWNKGLSSRENLMKLYMLESSRSYVLDINDDISGQSCTVKTIMKINKMINLITNNHEFMKKNDVYLYEDADFSKTELLEKYNKLKILTEKYLI